MTQILTPSLIVSPNMKIRRVRDLPVPGTIHTSIGARVSGAQVVASAERAGDLEIVRVAERLGIEPNEVKKGLAVSNGQVVKQGDLLCKHSGLFGLFRSVLQSPVDGVIEFFAERTGHLGIRLAPKRVELTAYITGRVIEIEPGKSVVIESSAALMQGIFGVGGERRGQLEQLSTRPDEVVSIDHIPDNCEGLILYGGMRPTGEALAAARQRGATGFICGSIDDRTLKDYVGFDIGVAVTGDEDVSMSLIITEGFGDIPISPRAIDLLSAHRGREASINGATQVRAGALRPEVIIPLPTEEGMDSVAEPAPRGLSVGANVRLIRFPFFGLQGEVVELPHALERLDTGAQARVLRAKLADGRVVTVPRANVELT